MVTWAYRLISDRAIALIDPEAMQVAGRFSHSPRPIVQRCLQSPLLGECTAMSEVQAKTPVVVPIGAWRRGASGISTRKGRFQERRNASPPTNLTLRHAQRQSQVEY
jgi:hypothetical protein